MRVKPDLAKLALACLATISMAPVCHAQLAERVDPTTGNYVPSKDPFSVDQPDPDSPNPNRMGNRLSRRNAPRTADAPAPPSANQQDDGLTSAQRQARYGAYNGVYGAQTNVAGMQAPDGSAEQTDTNGFVAMGGMAMYSPPGTSSSDPDPFAKPDWWPQ